MAAPSSERVTLLAVEDIHCPLLVQYKYNGAPVWPCHKQYMLQDLRKTLELSGLELTCIALEDTEPAILCPGADEIVVALSADNRREAELYANLTHRSVYTISCLEELSHLSNVAVLIATWDQIHVSDFEAIYEYCGALTSIGLIVGFDREDLHYRVLISAAFAYASQTMVDLPELPTHAIVGTGMSETLSDFFTRTSSAETESEVVFSLLRGPSSVLGVLSHSDGVDACLSSRAVLCPRVNQAPIERSYRPANCDCTDYCHRLQRGRPEALSSGQLISPGSIATRVLLMLSCYAAIPEDSSVHPEHGLMRELLHNPCVGAIVAPWEVAICYPEELSMLARLLAEGMDIGTSLYLFRRTAPGSINGCNRYLLFGDPSTRACSIPHLARSDPSSYLQAVWRNIVIEPTGRVEARASAPTIGHDDNSLLTSWICARMGKLMQYIKLDATGIARVNALIPDLYSSFTRRVAYREFLRVILSHERAGFVHWYEGDELGLPQFIDRVTFCFGCGAKGRLFRLQSRYSIRWMASCTQCNIYYADTPEGSELIDKSFYLTLDGKIAHNLPPLPNGVIGMSLIPPHGSNTAWLIDEEFNLTVLPPGRSWLWLHYLSDEGLYSFSRMLDNR